MIGSLVVNPAERGQGVGRRLLPGGGLRGSASGCSAEVDCVHGSVPQPLRPVGGNDALDAALELPLLPFSPAKRLAAEGLGSLLLVTVVVGSGIMGERLAAGNTALALLANAIATGAALVVLITALGPISGAHFNPVVTTALAFRKKRPWPLALGYIAVQVFSACLGPLLAHAMFALPLIQVSAHTRDGGGQVISEVVATFGLLLTIFGVLRFRPEATPTLVGLYITSAYWFTASTSFANPAVTIARIFTNTFAGIAPASAPLFVVAQLLGLALALAVTGWLLKQERSGG